jgi:hypothetical protein
MEPFIQSYMHMYSDMGCYHVWLFMAKPSHGNLHMCMHEPATYSTFMTVSRFVLGSSIRVLVFRRISLIWLD